LLAFFGPARERRAELAAKPGYVEEVLHAGADKLAPLAAETMRAVHDRMGLA
jgi:tryptophanyl-tRNA synthetase